MHVLPAQTQRLAYTQPRVMHQTDHEHLPGTPATTQYRRPLLAAKCFRERCLRPGPDLRARTVRNWPRSPASNPGGKNRNQRGSDNRSATAWSISPVRAQNRRNSHVAVNTALTVAPLRSRPGRYGVASNQCLNRARSGKLIVVQSNPTSSHHDKNTAVRPACMPGSCAPNATHRATPARNRWPPGARPTPDRAPPTARSRQAQTTPAQPEIGTTPEPNVTNVAHRVADTCEAQDLHAAKRTSLRG